MLIAPNCFARPGRMSAGTQEPSARTTLGSFLRLRARLLFAVAIVALAAAGITVAFLSSSSLNSRPGVFGISITVSLVTTCSKSPAGSDGSFTICFDQDNDTNSLKPPLANVSRMFAFAEQSSIGVGANATCPMNATTGAVLCSATVSSADWNTAAGTITVKTTFYSTTGAASAEMKVEFDPSRAY